MKGILSAVRARLAHALCGNTWHRGRDEHGAQVKVCDTCLKPRGPLLAAEVIRAAVARRRVFGEPTGKVQRVKKDNLTKFPERQSQR